MRQQAQSFYTDLDSLAARLHPYRDARQLILTRQLMLAIKDWLAAS